MCVWLCLSGGFRCLSLTLGCDGQVVPFVFPLSLFLSPFLPSPRDLRLLKLGVMQFVFVLPLWTAASLLADTSPAVGPTGLQQQPTPHAEKPIPTETKTIPGEIETIPGESNTIPRGTETIPREKKTIPKETETIPGTSHSMPYYSSSIAHGGETRSSSEAKALNGSEGPLWGAAETIPRAEETVPEGMARAGSSGSTHGDTTNETGTLRGSSGVESVWGSGVVAEGTIPVWGGEGESGGEDRLLHLSVPLSAALVVQGLLGVLLSVSMLTSMLSLSQFYLITEPYLQPYKPQRKFFLVQLFVFTNSWQRLFVWVAGLLGALPGMHERAGMSLEQAVVSIRTRTQTCCCCTAAATPLLLHRCCCTAAALLLQCT